MIYTNSPVITRHITPQKAAFEHYFGGLTHRTRFCMVIIHMIYKHFINQKLFRTLVPKPGLIMKFFPAWLKWLLPLIALAALSLYAAWLFLPQGSGVGKVLAALAHPSAAGLSLDQRVVLEVRLPRLITAILVGAVLAVSGLLLQTMTRNPLASPSLLSINAGAGLGIILTGVFLTSSAAGDFSLSVTPAGVNATALALAALVLLLGVFFAWNSCRAHERSPVALAIAALCTLAGLAAVLVFMQRPATDWVSAAAVQHFLRGTSLSAAAAIGGALSWSLVMYISYSGGRLQQNRLILAGIAVSAFCVALGRASLLLDEAQAGSVMRWLAGSLSNLTWSQLHQFWPWVLLPILPLLWLMPKLNLLRLSDDAAQSLGLSVRQLRGMVNVIVLLWVGASVAITGPIAFIGLLVPHLAKFWIGYDLRLAVPMSALLGALLLSAADVLAIHLAHPAQLPAGAVLAIIGAPCFVLLAKRRSDT